MAPRRSARHRAGEKEKALGSEGFSGSTRRSTAAASERNIVVGEVVHRRRGRLLRGRLPGRAFGALLWTLAGIAALSLPLHWLSLQAQFNMQWIVLLLPVHLALALVLGRRGLAPVPG